MFLSGQEKLFPGAYNHWIHSLAMAKNLIKKRFRGFLPVVVDVETGGLVAATDALLEVAAITMKLDGEGQLSQDRVWHGHIKPFDGARLDQAALKINHIFEPFHPLRMALSEQDALESLHSMIHECLESSECSRAILVGHNAFFDLSFIKAAWQRNKLPSFPFHSFSSIDTVSLGVLAHGQTVLSKIATAAGLEWDEAEAHSALYDTQMTAEIFCRIFNSWHKQERRQA